MDALETIFSRRSIRKYTEKNIPEDIVDTLLKAGMQAPSANNNQPWHFIVIDDKQTLNKLTEIHPYAESLVNIQLAIVLCGDFSSEPSPDYIAIDCAAATENILLAAHAMGLGGVWLGVYPRKERIDGIIDLLEIPEDVLPISIAALGHPDEKVEPESRFNPERVHKNKW